MKQFKFVEEYEKYGKGDLIDMESEDYHTVIHPLLSKGILEIVKSKTPKKKNSKKKKNQPIVPNLDINDDGVVDGKDASLAGKVLASRRRK